MTRTVAAGQPCGSMQDGGGCHSSKMSTMPLYEVQVLLPVGPQGESEDEMVGIETDTQNCGVLPILTPNPIPTSFVSQKKIIEPAFSW